MKVEKDFTQNDGIDYLRKVVDAVGYFSNHGKAQEMSGFLDWFYRWDTGTMIYAPEDTEPSLPDNVKYSYFCTTDDGFPL